MKVNSINQKPPKSLTTKLCFDEHENKWVLGFYTTGNDIPIDNEYCEDNKIDSNNNCYLPKGWYNNELKHLTGDIKQYVEIQVNYWIDLPPKPKQLNSKESL